MRTLIAAALLLISLAVFAQDAPKPVPDSLSDFADGKGTLKPVTRLAAKDLDECSGIVWFDGAWWAHNDSGDGPNLFRSATLDFAEAEKLAVPGAKAVDWEDITNYDGDLLACDIGDNGRKRDDITLYRVKYSKPADGKAGLKLAATYPVAWPDGAHDCEGAAVIDGKLHLVTKNRGEGFTGVYRFDELKDGAKNTPKLVGKIDVGAKAMVTSADYDAASGNLLVLSYSRVYVFPKDKLDGAPAFSTLLEANQCEALCMKDGTLYFTNEQRDVYAVADFLKRKPKSMLPPRVKVDLPVVDAKFEPDGTGAAWKDQGVTLPMRNVGEEQSVRWVVAGARLMIAGSLVYQGSFTSSNERGNRIGTSVWLSVATDAAEDLTGGEKFILIGDNGETGVDAWSVDVSKGAPKLTPIKGLAAKGKTESGKFAFEVSIPLTALFADGALPATCLCNLWGRGLNAEDPALAGVSSFGALHPYAWADVTIKQPK